MPDLSRERQRWALGDAWVSGVDEAGRGPLAGPVFAGAIILPMDFTHEVLNDSKTLSEKKLTSLFKELSSREDVKWSVSLAEVEEIDRVNILRATHAAMARAVSGLDVKVDYVLIDGLSVPGFPYRSESIVKGDGKSLSIAAASVLAKVSRDRRMLELAQLYPEYGFEKHKGYGTKEHLLALEKHGPCPIHRRSFAPVARLLDQKDEMFRLCAESI
jgi:ribonuclease HII